MLLSWVRSVSGGRSGESLKPIDIPVAVCVRERERVFTSNK
ncbi:TPA_asm: hypothetical protein HUJ06_031983 [Nelumbo nucifera]|uniref:Uncharacterized protein n=1 Tax=Nelumbo nucifera TaxID=4432 RepID=A0A822XES9_NELNU|nr:TPA_asm: hypothetical protein HUJ06_021407 [Nelumbo nucifera]DAD49549.1 TPA_asm: hypothetical protein HUJ06_031983 [Nelumbo nucifera]